MFESDNCVAAISTPYGKGGVAMIRISGNGSISVADRIFKFKSTLGETSSNVAIHGNIIYQDAVIDDGIAIVYRSPHSYTGEDTVEITCHGGILLSRLVLESVFANGAEPAEAGEFTKRAFLNGKLGLTRAEAVIDLIDAESTEKIKLASAQNRGVLSRKLNEIYDKLKFLISSIYVYIDFPDEDLTDVSVEEMKNQLITINTELEKLTDSYRTGKAVSEGIKTVIAGKPNTGKSSLLNLLVGEERAIVTNIAGTTRDTIEETVTCGRVLLRLYDTAGIRGSLDEVEKLGVKRAIDKLEEAELVLAVFDGSEEPNNDDFNFIERLKILQSEVIVIINKNDLPNKFKYEFDFTDRIIEMSAINNNKDLLVEMINELFTNGNIDYNNSAVITNARQYASIWKSKASISRAIKALESGYTQDLAGLDLENALSELGGLDGRTVSSDIVDSIFHRFCVGK